MTKTTMSRTAAAGMTIKRTETVRGTDGKRNEKQKRGGRAGTLIYGSLLLCLSSVVMRTVGVAFNVYISERAGAEAVGLYSLVGSVWGFALTLATSGIGLASTRCIAEARGQSEIRAILRRCVCICLFSGTGAALLLVCCARPAAVLWLHEPRAVTLLRLMGISLPAIAVSSALSGYFSARRRVVKSVVCQLAEQAVRIAAVSALLTPLLPSGPEYACAAIILGSAVSEIFGCVLSVLLYLRDRRRLTDAPCPAGVRRTMTSKLLGISLPVAFSACVRSALTTAEHILIPVGLRESGVDGSAALESYGILNGMVLPVVLFPYALIYSFTGLLVPEIAGSRVRGEKKRIAYISSRIWRLTLLFGFACAAVMAVCSRELGLGLYASAEAGEYVRALAPLLPVMYLDTVTDSLLKGLGEQVYTMNVNIADAAICVILVRLLVPVYGIRGYIGVLYASELINFAFSAARLLRLTGMRPRVFRWVFLPLACAVGASRLCAALFVRFPLSPAFPVWCRLSLHMGAVALTFLLFLRLSGGFDPEMRKWLRSALKPRRTEPAG